MSLLGACQWLQNTAASTAIRESIWFFPLLDAAHFSPLTQRTTQPGAAELA